MTESQPVEQTAEPNKCQECGAYKGHHVRCTLQPVEEKAAAALFYYEQWLSQQNRARSNRDRYCGIIESYRGKYLMLKHENNALRRKLHAR